MLCSKPLYQLMKNQQFSNTTNLKLEYRVRDKCALLMTIVSYNETA